MKNKIKIVYIRFYEDEKTIKTLEKIFDEGYSIVEKIFNQKEEKAMLIMMKQETEFIDKIFEQTISISGLSNVNLVYDEVLDGYKRMKDEENDEK